MFLFININKMFNTNRISNTINQNVYRFYSLFTIIGIILGILLLGYYSKTLRYKIFPNMKEETNLGLSIVQNKSFKTKKMLLKGTRSSNNGFHYNTNIDLKYDKEGSKRYVRLPPSVNVNGGAQFTYTFWINKQTNDLSDKIIFEKGVLSNEACPRVKFGSDGNTIIIEVATKKGTIEQFTIDDSKLNMLPSASWYMMTIILEDYFNNENFEQGIKMSFYLNNRLIDSSFRLDNNTIQQNNSKFRLFPDSLNTSTSTSTSGTYHICNLAYYNYAISYKEIENLYKNKANFGEAGLDLIEQKGGVNKTEAVLLELSQTNYTS
jgi:hypothetical protein